MHRYGIGFVALLFALNCHASGLGIANCVDAVETLSLEQLEKLLVAVESELESLAQLSLRSGMGSVGYRSDPSFTTPDHDEWVQINIGKESSIDQIVIVPSVRRDAKTGYEADGFPLEFRILAGNAQETNMVAIFDASDNILPRIAPLVVDCPSVTASWVRVEASVLTPRAFDGEYNLELSEIMVFRGRENIALRQEVQSSSLNQSLVGARKEEYLVDGFVPYLMDAAQGNQSVAFVSEIGIGDKPELTIDLGLIYPLNRIHLHSIDLAGSIPQTTPAGFGMPRRYIIEGALRPNFSDAVTLIDDRMEFTFDVGPIVMRRFPEASCRYVRLTAIEPYIYTDENESGSRMGFAEIEIFSKGQNVAIEKPVKANFKLISAARSFSALTDGRNLYGQILPVRDWLNELARRHDLEIMRPVISAELNMRYLIQREHLSRMYWLAMLLAVGIVVAILVERLMHLKQVASIRERYAADLHDELGANIHTLGLLGDVALSSVEDPERLINTLKNSRELTERTGHAVRHCINMQEVYGSNGGLKNDIERVSQRILADFDYDISITGEEYLEKLKPGTSNEIFLFYKESLVNISRHSVATTVNTTLVADGSNIVLTVSDNGRGLPNDGDREVPKALRRRARLMGAKVSFESSENEGTCVTLRLRTRRFWLV